MRKSEEPVDRRKHKRFQISSNVFAHYRTDSPKVVEIVDISLGGLAFSHIGTPEPPNVFLQLDIMFPDNAGYVEKLPCRTVSDSEIPVATGDPSGTRRCGVHFGELTDDQRTDIASFIRDYCRRVSK